MVDAESPEGGVRCPVDVVRSTVDAEPCAVLGALVAERRGEHDPLAPPRDGLADELLVGEGPVHVRRVEEGHAELEGPVDRRDRLGLVARAVELRHPMQPRPRR